MQLLRLISITLLLLAALACERSVDIPTPVESPSASNRSLHLIEDEVAGTPLVLIGSIGRSFVMAFDRRLDGTVLAFESVQRRFPVVMKDHLGNQWDVFGRAVSGPNIGEQLDWIPSGNGFWFMFGAMYPGLYLYGEGSVSAMVQRDTAWGWTVPTNAVERGADFDEIQSLDNPDFILFHPLESRPEESFYLEDEDLVVVVRWNGETKVYPHAILDWHEVINDEVGGVPISVTYSPLTGSTKVWKRGSTTFGVTGLVYNSNLLAFDRATESYWLQWEARSVFGSRRGEQLEQIPFLETSWETWRLADPTPLVVSGIQPDYPYPYGTYPYGDYITNDFVSYPLLYDDSRLPRKQRVFGVLVQGVPKVYQFEDFGS